MSLFLGKIHFWLFNKVLWFEGLEEEIINLAQEEGLDVNTLGKEIKDKYGKRTENKNLEEIIDTSNIHGWLQNKIHSAEGRMAAWTKAIYLDSTPQETLQSRLERNRDQWIDNPFTMMVLDIEQKMLKKQAEKAKLIVTRDGTVLDWKEYAQFVPKLQK